MRDIFFARNRNHQFLILRTGKPIRGRQIDVPHIPGDFELDPHMIERAISLRAPHPNNARWNHSWRPPRILMAHLEHDGRTRSRIADTLVLAAVAIHHYGFGGFAEWLAERVGSFDGDRGGMHHARAATLLGATPVRVEILRHVRLQPPAGTYFDGTRPFIRGQWNGDTSSKQVPFLMPGLPRLSGN